MVPVEVQLSVCVCAVPPGCVSSFKKEERAFLSSKQTKDWFLFELDRCVRTGTGAAPRRTHSGTRAAGSEPRRTRERRRKRALRIQAQFRNWLRSRATLVDTEDLLPLWRYDWPTTTTPEIHARASTTLLHFRPKTRLKRDHSAKMYYPSEHKIQGIAVVGRLRELMDMMKRRK